MIANKRDLGGLIAKDGRKIKPGLLIRSAHLFQAEEHDLAGVSAVIDLRTPGERREAPDKTYGRSYLPLPIFDDSAIGISHESGAAEQMIPDMSVLYGRMMTECADAFSVVLRTIIRHDFSTGAMLWHCTEGKDRCGMTTALVLDMLGVDRDTMMADYLKTNRINLPKAVAIRERLAKDRGTAFADSVYQAYIADEKYLKAAWEAMGDHYFDRLRITANEINAFRDQVLSVD
ncbi:MAG: tyrosine-protein phosphatase [Clostridia bacterium]|nr:tyrosine-protein phosphatase [Clostridia bacterium]